MNNLRRILTSGPRPSGADLVSQLLATLWDIELTAIVIPEIRQKAQRVQQQSAEVQTTTYDARRLTPRGLVE